MELGCFVAGVVISSNGEQLVHKVGKIFTKFLIASLGLIVFPFLLSCEIPHSLCVSC